MIVPLAPFWISPCCVGLPFASSFRAGHAVIIDRLCESLNVVAAPPRTRSPARLWRMCRRARKGAGTGRKSPLVVWLVKLQSLQGAAGRLCERSATTTETAANPSWIRQVPSLQPCKGCAGRREVDNGNTRPALRRASLGFPIILSVVRHGRGCVVIVVSHDVQGRGTRRGQ